MNINKNAVHKAGLVVAGMSIGGGVGYILAKKKYLAIADQEIESVKERFERRMEVATSHEEPLQEFMATTSPADEPKTEVLDVVKVNDYKEYQETVLQYKDEEGNPIDKAGAQEILDRIAVEVNLPNFTVDVDISENPEGNIMSEERDPTKPYVITETEYVEDRGEFDKVDLNYYDQCGTLTDDADSIIKDISRTIGNECLSRWGAGCDDDHTVFVRNERIATDFEISKVDNSYAEIVLGVTSWDADDIEETVKVKKMRDE